MRTTQRFASLAFTLLGAATATAVGCNGETLVVGTNEGGAPPGDDAAPSGSTGDANDTSAQAQACGVGAFEATSETDSAIQFSTCPSGGDLAGCASPGGGFVGLAPPECAASAGPVHAVTTAADVEALLIASWYGCDAPAFGVTMPSAVGVRFSSDGHYDLLFTDVQESLATTPPSGDAGVPTSGSFEVVDGSATYGAGTFELQLRPAQGGLIRGQVVFHDAPRQFQFFPPNAGSSVFSLAAPWTPRAGVCSCTQGTGTKVSANDASALAAAMIGRWIWCGGLEPWDPSGGLGMGVEFRSDGTWDTLEEEASGKLTSGAPGTFQLVPTDRTAPASGPGPEPLSLQLLTGSLGSAITQVAVTQNPRVLFLSQGVKDGTSNVYTILVPAP